MMNNKISPALDTKLTARVEAKISGLLQLTGAMIISDGWTSVQARAIVNALLATPAGIMFLEALDTSGNTKDARFIADFIIKIIETRGPANIVAVCMDGACTASFPLITATYGHVFCFICPANSIHVDNFFKNVFSDKMKMCSAPSCMSGQGYSGSQRDSHHFHAQPQGVSTAGLSKGGYTQKSATG